MYSAMGHAEPILILAERMHTTDPSRRVHREFGQIYLDRGMSEEAIKMFSRAVRINDTFSSRFKLGTAYHRRGRFAPALEEYMRCEKMDASAAQRAGLMFELARLHAQEGRNDEALACVDNALKQRKNDTWLMLKINILLNAGEYEEAKRHAENLLETASLAHAKSGAKILLNRINKLRKDNQAQEK